MQNISSSSTPVSVGSAVRRPKMSLNIPSVRTSGRHGGFKSVSAVLSTYFVGQLKTVIRLILCSLCCALFTYKILQD
jgi:hypothetical protein